jgi:hypothetical protein
MHDQSLVRSPFLFSFVFSDRNDPQINQEDRRAGTTGKLECPERPEQPDEPERPRNDRCTNILTERYTLCQYTMRMEFAE